MTLKGKQKILLGMGQLLVEGGEPERNLVRAEKMIKEAAERGCDVVLLPECLDLAWTHPSAKKEACPVPGLYSDRLCRCALDSNIYVCAGLTEKAEGCVYNTAVLIDSSGNIILKYRKINVLEIAQDFYAIGDSLSVVDTPFGKIGVNICADNYFDSLEIGHVLARMGAQIILSPSSWTVDYFQIEDEDPYKDKWFKPFFTLANLYELVIVSATSVGYIVGGPYEGKKMVGCSMAVNSRGIISKGMYNEFAGELVTAQIDIPQRKEKGTAIGIMLQRKGCYKDGKQDLLSMRD